MSNIRKRRAVGRSLRLAGCRHGPEELKGKPMPMPPLAGKLSAKDMSSLVAYLKTL